MVAVAKAVVTVGSGTLAAAAALQGRRKLEVGSEKMVMHQQAQQAQPGVIAGGGAVWQGGGGKAGRVLEGSQ